jgi:hypothetical protein
MEKIIEISQIFKDMLEASPWIWHGIQALFLINFLVGVQSKINWKVKEFI